MTAPIAIADRATRLLFYGLILAAPACGGGSGGTPAPDPDPPSAGYVYTVPEDGFSSPTFFGADFSPMYFSGSVLNFFRQCSLQK